VVVRDVGQFGVLGNFCYPFERARVLSLAKGVIFVQGEFWRPAGLLSLGKNLTQIDDRFCGFDLAEKEAPWPVFAPPMAKQFLGCFRCVFPAGFAPALHVFTQGVDKGQIVAVFLGQQGHLGAAGALGFEPIACWPSIRRFTRDAGLPVVKPVLVRFFVGRAKNRVLDGLNWDLLLWF
jgi:hypothetical protein